MASNAGKTVAEILEDNKGGIKQAPLARESPSWDDILHLTWEEVTRRARKREPRFKMFKKLLSDPEYNK